MRGPQTWRVLVIAAGVVGGAVFVGLLLHYNARELGAGVAAARWWIAAIIAAHFLPLLLDTLAWRAVLPAGLSLGALLPLRWAGEGVSTLLPATAVGGDVVRARLAGWRIGMAPAAAGVLGDVTVGVVTQIGLTLSGVLLLVYVTGRADIAGPAAAGAGLAALALLGFYAVQRYGVVRIIQGLSRRLARSTAWTALLERGAALDEALRDIYARPRGLLACAGWTVLSWAFAAAEVWLALWAIGQPRGYADAWILEMIGQGVRSALFLVPAALGVQEGGYVVVGTLLGLPPEASMKLALIRRVREIAIGVPGLLIWHLQESRRALARVPQQAS